MRACAPVHFCAVSASRGGCADSSMTRAGDAAGSVDLWPTWAEDTGQNMARGLAAVLLPPVT